MRAPLIGPKSRDEWIQAYVDRDSDTEYVTEPGEVMVWDETHGFFTYLFDAESRLLVIPKMCGDGKHWRKLIYRMYRATRGEPWWTRGVYCCTKRNPKAYMRILGGRVVKREIKANGQVLSFILISPEDTKEGRDCDVVDTDNCGDRADSRA
jgi:hypothetical protein